MAKKNLDWSVGDDAMVCSFLSDGKKIEFKYEDITDYSKSDCEIVQGLFTHGLKQKLADSVASASKNEWDTQKQIDVMTDVWDRIRSGVKAKRGRAKAPEYTLEQLLEMVQKVETAKKAGMNDAILQPLLDGLNAKIASFLK